MSASTRASLSAAAYQALFHDAPDAVVVAGSDGAIVVVSAGVEALFGFSASELIGQPIETLIPDRISSAVHELVASPGADPPALAVDPGLEPTGRRKDGTEFPAGISLSLVELDGQRCAMASIRDITDRQRFEGQRSRRTAKRVKAKRDDDQADLEAQLQQSQRLESVGQLAGGIAHDFSNLLAAIMNYAALISDCLDQRLDELGLADDEALATLGRDVESITAVAKRAAVLTHQLLTFSRRQVVQPTVFDLNSVVGDLEEILRRTIGENVDDLKMTLADDLPLIRADRGQIDQVVMNLAVNARDAMPGGGRLEIETAAFDVDDTYARERALKRGRHVRLCVSDSGTGMAPEVLERAFEPFFTTKPQGDGTGFGLATVYGIVRQAGGNVTIRSTVGEGTTVEVDLPATVEPVAVKRRRPKAAPRLSTGGETILLVEDEAIVREPARRLLSRAGYTVLAAGGADEAIAFLSESHGSVDLLLTDVVMPGRSGTELALEVKVLSPTTKVLFMSGYSSGVVADEGALDDGVSLLIKPFTADELLGKVRLTLDDGT